MNNKYSKELINEKIFDFIYNEALRDAVMRTAYNGDRELLMANKGKAKKNLRDHINKILNDEFKDPEIYDKDFLKTARSICDNIDNEFYFGNAQKLINMTVKHFYSICYYDPELRDRFKFCHCPLDSIMLKKVWGEYVKIFNTKERNKELKTFDFFNASWGREGQDEDWTDKFPERYKRFQDAVKKLIGDGNLFPIEFDFDNWK